MGCIGTLTGRVALNTDAGVFQKPLGGFRWAAWHWEWLGCQLTRLIVAARLLHTADLLHELLHNRSPERPKTHQNHSEPLMFHNNIRKVGSFRNRQVSGSSPLVGSILFSTCDQTMTCRTTAA